ncbi:heat-shock protein [Plesiocystis pacifica SIR-1]|uniref:Protein GrpE n=1 Tax=Plesiocystis pacifica SIR-1 TaxID=391625 RepID=A6G320_9BACT|nr:nucleotide exchange factor GrpE [Plesiocystis pacifica]EDM79645.1 heat-shock protein [Plesiocystis pacifica SIR-1]
MSGDQDASEPQASNPIEQAMREAEEAVDKVRAARDDDEDADLIDIEADLDGGEAEAEGEDAPAPDPVAELEAELAAAQAETAAMKDKWLRAIADHENYKKRVKRDIDDAVHRAVQNLLSSFLPIGDNLERALSVAPADANDQLVKGIGMVQQEFFSALAKQGITPVETLGKPFDPNVHDALQQIDSPDYPPGVVAIEYEKGYRRGDKLLRPARVVVAGPGSTGEAPDASEGEGSDADAEPEAN